MKNRTDFVSVGVKEQLVQAVRNQWEAARAVLWALLGLVVGLGNRAITPDAVGPKVHEYTLVTRHLVRQVPEHFGDLRPVASLSAGVLGTTGMESGELVRAVSERPPA